MSGPLGTSGGGAAGVTSVTAGNGITVTGTTTPTIAASIAAGTGVSIAGTTTLTVSATGVNSVSAGTGISVSGTTALTVSATGVQSLTAGNGITVSGTTTPTVSASLAAGTGIGISGTTTLSVSNTGVTSLVAGTNVSVSGATGAVTVNAPAFATAGSSAVGDSAAAGTATTVARSDHQHGREAFGTPGASAVADTASAGTATTVARSDHRHSREAFGTPVVVNGQTTSLGTGSLTTLARADHVHTVSNVPVLIASTTLGSDAATISFTSIAGTYKHLKVIGTVRSSYAGPYDLVKCIINSDTAGNYFSNQDASITTEWRWSVVAGATDYLASAGNGSFDVNLPGYASTSGYKFFTSFMSHPYSTTSTRAVNINYFGGYWLSTSAITSIALSLAQGGNFKSGGIVSLYGYP